MQIPPQKQREVVFLLLYSSDFGSSEEVIEIVMKQLAVSKKNVREAVCSKDKILEKLEEIDALIGKMAESYAFDRIPRIEKNILRLSVYELLHLPEVPPKVAIAEAIRLCRKFATPEAATFVNAVMDSVYQGRLDVPVVSG